MPYIKQQFRDEIDTDARLSHLAEYLAATNDENFVGGLNYIINFIVRKRLQRMGLRYFNLNNIVGSITCALLELYRTIAGPYEDEKMGKNGEIKV